MFFFFHLLQLCGGAEEGQINVPPEGKRPLAMIINNQFLNSILSDSIEAHSENGNILISEAHPRAIFIQFNNNNNNNNKYENIEKDGGKK